MPKNMGPCIICKVRQARHVNLTCGPCRALVDAEGTHELHGISKETPVRQRWRQEVAEYNKLIRKGVSQDGIAALWGVTVAKLRRDTYRWKAVGRLKVMPGWTKRSPVGAPTKPTSTFTPRVPVGHGEGRWGVQGCKCDPCRAVRRVTRADLEQRRKNKPS